MAGNGVLQYKNELYWQNSSCFEETNKQKGNKTLMCITVLENKQTKLKKKKVSYF